MYPSTTWGAIKMRQSWKKSRSILLVGLTATLFLACGSSTTTQPSGNSAAGNYTANIFVTSGNSGQRNEIAAGSTLVLNLTAAGTTSGHLHIAATGAIQAFDADMAGTWTQSDYTVTISQSADTFVRNTPFQLFFDPAGGWELVGDQVFSGTLFHIVLKRA
jgi:hypothetical protein